jgi:hypothetical protein
MRLNPAIWPPGGWRYTQPETGFVFTDSSMQGLMDKVAQHRLANKLPAGDPEQDISEQIIKATMVD